SGGWDGEAAAFAFVFRIPPWPDRSKNPENKKRSESQPPRAAGAGFRGMFAGLGNCRFPD
ncbi:MAG: hypothetical protein J7639_21880, partial [Paenibacillaceae bacterium]|nr:hypothetical protein [Paenibacillaceae bacterium]